MIHSLKKTSCAILALGLISVLPLGYAADQTPAKILKPEDVQWGPSIPNVPKEVSTALIVGNPTKSGPFVIRVKFPAKFEVQPHKVDAEQYITVLSGSLNMGFGDKFDKKTTTNLPAGSFFILPANSHQYLWTDEESVVQISGNGPIKYETLKQAPEAGKTETKAKS